MSSQKRNVLDEDEFTGQIENIIKRDFFPELPKLEWEIKLMQAQKERDVMGITIAKENLARIEKQNNAAENEIKGTKQNSTTTQTATEKQRTTGWEDDDDEEENEDHSEAAAAAQQSNNAVAASKMSLNEFLSSNTSEDNASFSLILEKEQKKHKERMKRYYGDSSVQLLAIKAAEKEPTLAIQGSTQPVLAITNGEETTKMLSAAPNNFMFTHQGPTQKQVSELEGLAAPKEIKYNNTRLDPSVEQQMAVSAQTALVEGENLIHKKKTALDLVWGIDGVSDEILLKKIREERSSSDGFLQSYDLDNLVKGPSQAVGSTPVIAGYKMVHTPAPAPDKTPVMTWGSVEGAAPLESYTPARSFKVPETPLREKLSHRLAEEASKSITKKIKQEKRVSESPLLGARSPQVHSGSAASRLTGLTSAAQLLAAKLTKTGATPARTPSSSSFASSLRSTYSPSPARSGIRSSAATPLFPSSTPSIKRTRTDAFATPIRPDGENAKKRKSSHGAASVTDDLLNTINVIDTD